MICHEFLRIKNKTKNLYRLENAKLRHAPIALLLVKLLQSWPVQTTDHVPSRAAAPLADFDAALREFDHHVVGGEILDTFAAVPLAGDLVDLPRAAAAVIGRSQLDGHAIAVGCLVGVDVAELPRRPEDAMGFHSGSTDSECGHG